MADRILEGYAAAAKTLRPRYDAIDPALYYAAVLAHFPQKPSQILDIGAGTGRDAAWLAGLGHEVLAVEPVAAFRVGKALTWLDDRLPDLRKTRALGRTFDFILMNAVFQHVKPAARAAALRNIAGLLAQGGRIVLSLRHGPSAETRRAYPFKTGEVDKLAAACGLATLFQCKRRTVGAANKAAGVRWEFMVLGWAG
ncbi:MAG: methyltransferase domain-containing protein [Rhodobacteraceae bacterium]|nr:methyltransferase domain-containing protein [Paracoccaceae bacterium]